MTNYFLFKENIHQSCNYSVLSICSSRRGGWSTCSAVTSEYQREFPSKIPFFYLLPHVLRQQTTVTNNCPQQLTTRLHITVQKLAMPDKGYRPHQRQAFVQIHFVYLLQLHQLQNFVKTNESEDLIAWSCAICQGHTRGHLAGLSTDCVQFTLSDMDWFNSTSGSGFRFWMIISMIGLPIAVNSHEIRFIITAICLRIRNGWSK